MSIDLAQLGARFQVAADKLGIETGKALDRFAQIGVGYVKDEIHNVHAVDTGTMLNSTQAEKSGQDERLVGPTVTYAPYVALGTSRVVGRPFHIAAARRLEADIKEFMSPEDLGL
jgi:hypothetical protein